MVVGNVTNFLRGCHLFVTPGCNAGRRKPVQQKRADKPMKFMGSASSSASPASQLAFLAIAVRRIGEYRRSGANEINSGALDSNETNRLIDKRD